MAAKLTLHDDRVPLREDENGAIRVGKTRLLFYLMVEEFERGADPESMTRNYPSLDLADAYSIIGYYLRHKAEVDEYIRTLNAEADEARRAFEEKFPPRITREILEARKRELEARRASAGQ